MEQRKKPIRCEIYREKELWKPVKILYRFDSRYNIVSKVEVIEGYYISSMGRLQYKGKIRKNKPEKKGYIQDYLFCKNGKRERFKRHQILMQTFYPDGIRDGITVDHKDRNGGNNELSNLRWAEMRLQMENRENAEYKYKSVVCENDWNEFLSCQAAEDYYGLVRNTVSRVARGERKSIHGLKFRYLCEVGKYKKHKKSKERLDAEMAQMRLCDFMEV